MRTLPDAEPETLRRSRSSREDKSIGGYQARKAALRQQVAGAGPEALTVFAAVGIWAFRLISGPSGAVPPPKPPAPPSPVALAAPSMLHGTPVRPGGAPGTLLFLGGQELRLLNVREQAPTSLARVLPDAGDARNE